MSIIDERKRGVFVLAGHEAADEWSNLVGRIEKSLLEDIVRFLEGGGILLAAPGRLRDWFRSDRQIGGPMEVKTDGTWVWPGELAWHVREYSLGLPDAFVTHMKGRKFIPRSPSEEELERLAHALRPT